MIIYSFYFEETNGVKFHSPVCLVSKWKLPIILICLFAITNTFYYIFPRWNRISSIPYKHLSPPNHSRINLKHHKLLLKHSSIKYFNGDPLHDRFAFILDSSFETVNDIHRKNKIYIFVARLVFTVHVQLAWRRSERRLMPPPRGRTVEESEVERKNERSCWERSSSRLTLVVSRNNQQSAPLLRG